MKNIIRAIILDGFHKGHVITMQYMPVVRLIKPRNITVDYCCDGDMIVNDPIKSEVEYKECFRSVDGKVILYSEKGNSQEVFTQSPHEVTNKPWNEFTTLYFGYHNEPIERKDDGTQKTEFDRGFERGVEEGKYMQKIEFEKKFNKLK